MEEREEIKEGVEEEGVLWIMDDGYYFRRVERKKKTKAVANGK